MHYNVSKIFSHPDKAEDPSCAPDVEVWFFDGKTLRSEGYYWYAVGNPLKLNGPFASRFAAEDHARMTAEHCFKNKQ